MYTVEYEWFRHGERDSWYYECETLQEAVEWLNRQYHGSPAWGYINGRKLEVRDGCARGKDGEPFCTNQGWHNLSAPYDYPQIMPLPMLERLKVRDAIERRKMRKAKHEARVPLIAGDAQVDMLSLDQVRSKLRPVPTNPATHRIVAVRSGDAVQFIDHGGAA